MSINRHNHNAIRQSRNCHERLILFVEEEVTHKLYTTGEAAAVLGIPISTQKEWEKRGYISRRHSSGAHRRYDEDDLRRLMQIKQVVQRYRFEEKVRQALDNGEYADVRLPWEKEQAETQRPDVNTEAIIDLAARNAEMFGRHHRLLKELEADYDFLSFIMDNSPAMILAVNQDCTISYANRAVRRVGVKPEDLIGRPVSSFIMGGRESRPIAALKRLVEGKKDEARIIAKIAADNRRTITVEVHAAHTAADSSLPRVVLCAAPCSGRIAS